MVSFTKTLSKDKELERCKTQVLLNKNLMKSVGGCRYVVFYFAAVPGACNLLDRYLKVRFPCTMYEHSFIVYPIKNYKN